jgi:hypothetical protein
MVSIQNGPRLAAALQFPAVSRVWMWNQELAPPGRDGLVVPRAVSSASFVVSGMVDGLVSNRYRTVRVGGKRRAE